MTWPLLHGSAQVGASVGDWDDVDNAVSVAANKTEMAVVESRGEDGAVREYDLLTAADEPARVRVRRIGAAARAAGAPASPGEFQVEANVGRFGNPAVERALIDHITARLHDLTGVDYAPVR